MSRINLLLCLTKLSPSLSSPQKWPIISIIHYKLTDCFWQTELDQFTITNSPADVSEQCSNINIDPTSLEEEREEEEGI